MIINCLYMPFHCWLVYFCNLKSPIKFILSKFMKLPFKEEEGKGEDITFFFKISLTKKGREVVPSPFLPAPLAPLSLHEGLNYLCFGARSQWGVGAHLSLIPGARKLLAVTSNCCWMKAWTGGLQSWEMASKGQVEEAPSEGARGPFIKGRDKWEKRAALRFYCMAQVYSKPCHTLH